MLDSIVHLLLDNLILLGELVNVAVQVRQLALGRVEDVLDLGFQGNSRELGRRFLESDT